MIKGDDSYSHDSYVDSVVSAGELLLGGFHAMHLDGVWNETPLLSGEEIKTVNCTYYSCSMVLSEKYETMSLI